MDEAVVCRCLWPAKVYDTLTGHATGCPVEIAAHRKASKKFAASLDKCPGYYQTGNAGHWRRRRKDD